MVFDKSEDARWEAIWGFIRTNVLIMLLALQATFIAKDVHQVLVRPMEVVSESLAPFLPKALKEMSADDARALGGKCTASQFTQRLHMLALRNLTKHLTPTVRRPFARGCAGGGRGWERATQPTGHPSHNPLRTNRHASNTWAHRPRPRFATGCLA